MSATTAPKKQQQDESNSKPSTIASQSFLTPSQALRRSNTNGSTSSTTNSNDRAASGAPSAKAPSGIGTTTNGPQSTKTSTAPSTKTLGPSWLNKNKQNKNDGGYGAGGGADANDGKIPNPSASDSKKDKNANRRRRRGGGDNNGNEKNAGDDINQSDQPKGDNPRRGGNGGRGRGRGKGRGGGRDRGGRGDVSDRDKPPSKNSDEDNARIDTRDNIGHNGNNSSAKSSGAKNRNKSRRKNNKNTYPWREQLKDVDQEEDPITLDRLDELEYPPFVLCRDAPFVPVPEWPVPPEEKPPQDDSEKSKLEEQRRKEELNRQRLAEQWGIALLPDDKIASPTDTIPKPPELPLSERKLWFFDGRALALYMVKQLQFVNPFDRRDLTRPELVNLDKYLKRHRLDNGLNVTDAYDAKGISLSSAGAAAYTAEGRAQIMREMAEGLYNSLFSRGFDSLRNMTQQQQQQQQQHRAPRSTTTNPLQDQYAAMQLQERRLAEERRRRQEQQQESHQEPLGFGEAGIYGSAEEGGFMIIDDDQNPGLRSQGDQDAFPALTASADNRIGTSGSRIRPSSGGPLDPHFDGSRITGTAGSGTESAFPALPSAATSSNTTPSRTTNAVTTINEASGKKPPAKTSKTLNKIGGLIKKTSEQERQRQYMAREEARKKAMMANLSFGMNPTVLDPSQSVLSAPPQNAEPTATEEQINRNRAFADALGVTPATKRHYASGWARPTNGAAVKDEFGQELGAALYPDTLIAQAKERTQLLLKLEKRWKTFLADDKAASLPLNHMDKANRAFVHAYAEFWKVKTESFDPEPKRYIHCVKMLETRMPNPLLSTVAREWRGPLPDTSKLVRLSSTDHASFQTAGQSSKSRDPNVPVPRLLVDLPSSARLVGILGRERPKLDLAPRTLPTELPPFENKKQAEYETAEDVKRRQERLNEQRRREQLAKEKEQQILQEAFASDDEDSYDGMNVGVVDKNNVDDDWGDAPAPLYQGDDDD